jgi:hypothetical protein
MSRTEKAFDIFALNKTFISIKFEIELTQVEQSDSRILSENYRISSDPAGSDEFRQKP